MRFLIIGCGSIGLRHLRNLKALGASDLISFDIQADRREVVEQEIGIPTFRNLPDALAARPEAVFVTTPTSLHIQAALESAKQGCHLFIEKPLSHNRQGLAELLSLVKKQGLLTLVGCNMRYHPGLVRVKSMLENGAIGRVIDVRAQFGQWLPDWHPEDDYRKSYSASQKLGGGIILDAIHELDYVQWLVASPVRQVACLAGTLSRLEIDTEDTAAISLRFANNTLGEVHLDYVQRKYSRSCQVIGEEGTIWWDYNKGQVSCYLAAKNGCDTCPDPLGWEPNQMYLDEMQHWLQCLDGKEKPAVDIYEGNRVLEIALAAKLSAQTGQIVPVEES